MASLLKVAITGAEPGRSSGLLTQPLIGISVMRYASEQK